MKIESLSQFINEINSIVIHRERGTELPKLLFRGQNSSRFGLVPSLGRYPSRVRCNSWTMVEKNLVQFAQQKFPLLFSDTDYPLLLLAKLQHHGIYTRMLDVTENALVALYFACSGNRENSEDDGEVFAFQAQVYSAYDLVVNAVADTYRLTGNAATTVKNYYYRMMHRPYSTRWLYPGWEDDLDRRTKYLVECMKQPIFVDVGNVCERQKNQGGCFAIFPNKTIIEDVEDEFISDELVTMEKDDPCVVKRLQIAAKAKPKILKQLKRFGITEEFLFADDVDKVLKSVVSEQRLHYPDDRAFVY